MRRLRNLRQNLFVAAGIGSILISFNNCSPTTGKYPTDNESNKESNLNCLQQLGVNEEWSNEVEVPIDGYSGNAMEPKVSADQVVLFWNDKPASDSDMNLHYAVKQGNGRYLYIGTLPGTVDNNDLDGVAAIDAAGNFYFVSTRSYISNFQTIYGGQIQVLGPNSLQVNNVVAVDN